MQSDSNKVPDFLDVCICIYHHRPKPHRNPQIQHLLIFWKLHIIWSQFLGRDVCKGTWTFSPHATTCVVRANESFTPGWVLVQLNSRYRGETAFWAVSVRTLAKVGQMWLLYLGHDGLWRSVIVHSWSNPKVLNLYSCICTLWAIL